MLGSVKTVNDWQWAAYGKHPTVRDYVSLGDHLPLVKTLSTWIDKGFEVIRARTGGAPRYCSWRFWAGGSGGDALTCGLLRDSRDGAGRPYPFLVLGSGSLNRWKDHWELLPFVCERAWNQMEQATVRTYESLRGLEDAIQQVAPPALQWSEYEKQREGLWELQDPSENRRFREARTAIEQQVGTVCNAPEFYVSLQPWPQFDPMAVVSCWHSLLKTQQAATPNVVFMGGSPTSVSLVIYKRPLTTDDFVRLWSEDASLPGTVESR